MGIFDWMDAKETRTDKKTCKEYIYNLTSKEVTENHPTAGNLRVGFEDTTDKFKRNVDEGKYRK